MRARFRFPNRHTIRTKGYDYRTPGAYFVTLCTKPRIPLFGNITDGRMRLNRFGIIARRCWLETHIHFPNVRVDEFIVMPDHVHALIVIRETDRCKPYKPIQSVRTSAWPNGPLPGSLGAIVGSYKSAVSKEINRLRNTPGAKIWLRNYHEHILWNRTSLERVRLYIRNNPRKAWEKARKPET